jgi:hypothetical protein
MNRRLLRLKSPVLFQSSWRDPRRILAPEVGSRGLLSPMLLRGSLNIASDGIPRRGSQGNNVRWDAATTSSLKAR